MIYILGPLFTIVLVFFLCKSEENAMEAQRKYWIKNQKEMEDMQWGWSY